MNLGVIARPNAKGQVVIPKKYRDELGIGENMLLNIILHGRGVYITPVKEMVSSEESRKLFMDVLKRTAGSWAQDNWPVSAKKRQQIELEASKQRKKSW